MIKIFDFLHKYSLYLIFAWMGLYAVDLIDDLRNNYVHRPGREVAWMLVSDIIRCLLVVVIWVASNYNAEEKKS